MSSRAREVSLSLSTKASATPYSTIGVSMLQNATFRCPASTARGKEKSIGVIVFTGLLLLVGYAWMRQNERGLEQGKALTEMSGQALQASGYQLMSWGEEHRKGKTATPYPQKYEGIHSRRYTVSLVIEL
jgi:hypothetical protein